LEASPIVIACSGGSSNNSSSSSGGSSGSTSGAATSGSGAAGGSSYQDCNRAKASNCSDADYKPYQDCLSNKCGDKLTACYGADYQNGNFSGPCADYIGCVQKCGCSDTNCILSCTPSQACQDCSKNIGTCTTQCTAPACASSSGGTSGGTSSGGTSSGGTSGSGGTHTCAQLQACCDKMAAGTVKTTCQQAHDSSSNNDSTCNAIYGGFASSCP
jgi:hypothetical protein